MGLTGAEPLRLNSSQNITLGAQDWALGVSAASGTNPRRPRPVSVILPMRRRSTGPDRAGVIVLRATMKTLAKPADKAEIVRRLGDVTQASRRLWGKMTAPEMICHLCDALRAGMGERHVTPVSTWATGSLMKWAALWFPAPWPHGVKTVPECEAGVGGTPPTEMDRDKDELHEILDRFTGRPRAYELQRHPIFGLMSEKEWMRWGYLHMDHHLRQFGA